MNDKTQAQTTHLLEREPNALQPHVANNTKLVDAVVDRNHSGFLARLMPSEADRVVREHELEQLKTGFEYRRRALQMAVEMKLQAVEEMCNDILVSGKSEIRRKRQEFFAEQKLKLQQAMNDCADRFNDEMARRFDALERMHNATLREREEQRLLKAVDQFHDMLDQLGHEFMDIIHEGVRR